jgi:DNA topoisomerase IA
MSHGTSTLVNKFCSRYGEQYATEVIRKYLKKVKNAQEAHEAIRPTSIRRSPCNKPTCSFVFTDTEASLSNKSKRNSI